MIFSFLAINQATTQAPFSMTVRAPMGVFEDLIHNCIAKSANPGSDFYSVASTAIQNSGNHNIIISKLDLSGNVLWSEEIDVGNDDRALDVIVDQFDNIVVTGFVGDANNHELYVVKVIDAENSVLTEKIIKE